MGWLLRRAIVAVMLENSWALWRVTMPFPYLLAILILGVVVRFFFVLSPMLISWRMQRCSCAWPEGRTDKRRLSQVLFSECETLRIGNGRPLEKCKAACE